jgi:regulator of replication initiation timing
MRKADIYQKELAKLQKIFEVVEESKKELVQGLIEDAAFLAAENNELREILSASGMIKVHPKYPELQKPTEAGKQYLKNINSYSVVIKTLNGILNKNAVEGEDEFDKFIKGMQGDD